MIQFKQYTLLFITVFFISISSYSQKNYIRTKYQIKNALPADFTDINVDILNEPSQDGYLFFAFFEAWGYFPGITPYLVITDNYATPIFYQKMDLNVMDFKLQPDGQLSFYGGLDFKHFLMNDKYEISRSLSVNGYGTDFHDFHIMSNGDFLLLGQEYRLVDMDTVVPGGHTGVTVISTYIEIQDSAGMKKWSWSGFDHFQITDAADYQVDLTDSLLIDYVHANALDMDTDTTLLISCRNMDEITKININTGEIIWRLGGKKNEFTYTNDTSGFYMQHDIRKLSNGLFQIFDNGFKHSPVYSSVVQYDLDEVNKTATLVRRFRSTPDDIIGWIMGSAQELSNGNTLVGWGSGVPNITEFKPDNSKALEFSFQATSYRAFRFYFEPMAFSFDMDSLNFGYIHPSDSSMRLLEITNNLTEDISINNILSRTGKFNSSVNSVLNITAGDSGFLEFKFKPGEEGIFDDVLTICYDIEDQNMTRRIAKQINVTGIASNDAGIAENFNYLFSAYPNPINNKCVIHFYNGIPDEIFVLDIPGQIVKQIYTKENIVTINCIDLKPGIYILSARYSSNKIVNKKIIKR